MRHAAVLYLAVGALGFCAEPEPVAPPARVEASSQASPAGGPYAVERAFDGLSGTHWASRDNRLPQWVAAEWPEPVTADTAVLAVFGAGQSPLYAAWRRCEVRLDNGSVFAHVFEAPAESLVLRLEPPQTFRRAEVHILEVFESRHYVGLSELTFHRDPGRLIRPARELRKPLPRSAMTPAGRPEHPCVYLTRAHLERARRNADATRWGRAEKAAILAEAERWLAQPETYWLGFLPEPGACYAYGFTGCPVCGASTGTWGGTRCSWDRPRTIECAQGHVLPGEACPDDGLGYQAPDGRWHYLVGSWNAWVTEQWTTKAIPALAHAYALTGDERYAERAALFLDALASRYAESTSGSWDYPSRPPSGRFARPWYQVARTLVVFVDAYDLIYSSAALDRPSLRPALEASAPPGPTPQERAVGAVPGKGVVRPGMTRRQNIDLNLMIDGAQYCYEHTFATALHNGHADYMRGALAVGALLGIEPYVDNALESPCSIRVMLANNADRDGRYFETALGYAIHARELYLSFVEPLLYWRSPKYPAGVNLFEDARMRSFYQLPALSVDCAGHAPNFGDAAPDNQARTAPEHPFSESDARFAEWLYAYSPPELRQDAARLLAFLARGDVERMRADGTLRRWLLYRGEELPAGIPADLPETLRERVAGSWVMGQKGIALLRDGRGPDAQAVLLRYGPSLNHGDRDDLGLLYYARGWQLTYEIGYGLASTHAHVGWAAHTISHCLVTVDEASQSGGSGGDLTLFAELPSLRVVEAESPLSYRDCKVTQYRRTAALVGSGADQVLVDLFRVRGGTRHDYSLGVQTRDVAVSGVDLGPEEEGSLAGREYAWGEAIGADGDVKGHPNKPYWNPPPGNGYGFLCRPRRAAAAGPFLAEFAMGGPGNVRFRVHVLPEAGTEAVLARAPGLYPHNRSASYVVLRRKAADGTALASAFAVVMEPYGSLQQLPAGSLGAARLRSLVVESSGGERLLEEPGILYLAGARAGDGLTFEVPVAGPGPYRLYLGLFRSPAYGTVRVLLDGRQLGEPLPLTHTALTGPEPFALGPVDLAPGPHRLRLELCPGGRLAFGASWAALVPAGQPDPALPEAVPLLTGVSRVPVETADSDVAPVGVRFTRLGREEVLLSASPEDDGTRRAVLPWGEVSWRGALVFAAFREGRLERVATHGAWDLHVRGASLGPGRGRYAGRVTGLDEDRHTVDVGVAIPADGIGPMVTFRNPGYSRDTSYRIHGLAPLPGGGTRIDLGPQPLLLGCGRVHQILPGRAVTSDVPHEFARSVNARSDTGFFDGKRVTNGRGATTTIRRVVYGEPMRVELVSTEGLVEDDPLFYYDVSVGDEALVYTAWEGSD